jgi:hypothetical protein
MLSCSFLYCLINNLLFPVKWLMLISVFPFSFVFSGRVSVTLRNELKWFSHTSIEIYLGKWGCLGIIALVLLFFFYLFLSSVAW